jgi:CheY-like chemotaxis protein
MSAFELPARRRAPCTVLVVDDDDTTRLAVRVVLEHHGFVVREASRGLEALALAQMSRPRVVLLDLVLPEIDGPQLAEMLRRDPAMCDAALIAVSASADDEDRRRALDAGCNEFLYKPMTPASLAGAIIRQARRPPRIRL